MNNSKYRGVVVPMVTPVTQDGRLDTEAVTRIINFFVQNKVSPLLMGTTGEGNSVSQADGQLSTPQLSFIKRLIQPSVAMLSQNSPPSCRCWVIGVVSSCLPTRRRAVSSVRVSIIFREPPFMKPISPLTRSSLLAVLS